MAISEEITLTVLRELPAWLERKPTLRQRLRASLVDIAADRLQAMTYAEFLEWADEDSLAEWVDAEVVMTSPASRQHQNLSDFLLSVLRTYVEFRRLGITISAPFQMKLANGREPDLLFVANEHLDRLRQNFLDGPADLVMEIVSPESAGRDRGEKYYEYAQGGVPEYWLIDPQTRWVEVYTLAVDHYRTLFAGRDGVARSVQAPGFWLRVEWLWQSLLPAMDDVLLTIDGEAYARHLIERLRARGYL